jgi:shikimate dehydrogenase
MTGERPLLVATLPARSSTEAASQIASARTAGADLAEVRFDRWPDGERSRAGALFPSALPLLATLRSRAEGGEGPDDPAERRRILRELARHPFHGIDLERARDLSEAGLPATDLPALRVISSHLAEGTPIPVVARELRASVPNGAIRKVVVPSTLRTALRDLIPSLPDPGEGPRVLLTTGPSGPLLRAWASRLQFPLVFGSLPSDGAPPRPAAVEPSQIPVDRFRAFLDGGSGAPLFALIGHPVAHSQSPYLHARWMRAGAHSGLYISLDAESESEFVDALPALADGGFRGINVTHPWKPVALAAASRVARPAELCAVANCLTLRGDEIEADNTDMAAILRRLDEYRTGGRWDGRELVVVGAGGAAAATLAAAREMNAEAFLYARAPDRGQDVARRFGATVLGRSAVRPFSLVVHATPVGRAGEGSLTVPIDGLISRGGQVLDWVYSPESGELRNAAGRAGSAYEDGWRLLVYQAAASFALWWGTAPSSGEIDATLREGPCAA